MCGGNVLLVYNFLITTSEVSCSLLFYQAEGFPSVCAVVNMMVWRAWKSVYSRSWHVMEISKWSVNFTHREIASAAHCRGLSVHPAAGLYVVARRKITQP
jgi:hypothetical protein